MAFSRKARTVQRKKREEARGIRKVDKEWERWGFDTKEQFEVWNNEPVRKEDFWPICHEETPDWDKIEADEMKAARDYDND
jgi:hypothetical protein